MKKTIQNAKRYILLSMLGMAFFVMSVLSFFPGKTVPLTVYANAATSLDSTKVENDFTQEQMAKIEQEYANCVKDELYVVSFVEYCFPYDINYSGNFGLYIYVYNPSAKTVIVDSGLHNVKLRLNDSKAEKPFEPYSLKCLSVSSDGKFIKFRIIDKTSSAGESILTALQENKLQRIYDVSELEVQHVYGQNVEAYTVGKKYSYTGFAKGYGQDSTKESTVDVYIESLMVIPEREVHHTSWRPEGTNGEDDTQDLLASVYFTLPNTVTNEQGEEVNLKETYGNLYGVHAKWIEALTKPMLVTGTEEVYNGLRNYIGKDISSYYDNWGWSSQIPYGFCTDYQKVLGSEIGINSFNSVVADASLSNTINPLYWILPSKYGLNAADTYIVDSEELKNYATEYSKEHTNHIDGTVYSKDLFESWIQREDTLYAIDNKNLTSVTLSENWLLGFFGFKESTPVSVPVIQEVTECSTAWQVENDYYVNQDDFSDFKKAFDEDNTTLYVFHFAVNDYYSAEVTQFKFEEAFLGLGRDWQKVLDTNAFLAQETAYLNFDIIDVTLKDENGTQTVFGFVANPIDIFPDATPPLDTTTDLVLDFSDLTFYLRLLAGLIVLAIVLAVFGWAINPILSALGFIITLPFNLLKTLFHGKGGGG